MDDAARVEREPVPAAVAWLVEAAGYRRAQLVTQQQRPDPAMRDHGDVAG
jgi:hypothetical protein